MIKQKTERNRFLEKSKIFRLSGKRSFFVCFFFLGFFFFCKTEMRVQKDAIFFYREQKGGYIGPNQNKPR